MGPHPQRELLVVSLTNKRKICHPPQREVLFAYFNFSLSPPLPSTRTSRCIVEKFVNPLKRSSLCLFQFFTLSYPTLNENFSLYRSKTCHPSQREVLFAYFNFSLSPTPPSTRTSRCIVENLCHPPQREVLFAYFNFSLSP